MSWTGLDTLTHLGDHRAPPVPQPMPLADPVEALRRLCLSVLAELEEGYCLSLRGFRARCSTDLHPEVIRGVMADLRERGLVTHCRGLMTEDGEMAGSGWGITSEGAAYLRLLVLTATAQQGGV